MKVMLKNDPTIPEIDCGAEERKAMLYWFALEQQARIGEKIFEQRLKLLPKQVRKDFKAGMYFLSRAMDKMWISCNGDTQLKLHRILSNAKCELKPNNSIDRELHIVEVNDFRTLCNMVIADRCSICVNDERQQKRCKLRRLLMRVCPPCVIDRQGTHCQYMDIAFEHDDGDFFSVAKSSSGEV